jgi:K+-sensing histidine kinase KdpD
MTTRSSSVEQNTGRYDDRLFYRGAGPLAAILLGMVLMPLRGVTTASNLSFAFIALTLVVSRVGGRWAAVATALVSALSLNFFLTQPYLHLAIHDKDDLIAFVGLAACGLIAASLGPHRGRR